MSAALGCSLLVAAASDLSPLEKPLASSIPQCSIRFTFGSSGMIAEQIRHGADYDLFLSANEAYVDRLIAMGGPTRNQRPGTPQDESALVNQVNCTWKDLRPSKRSQSQILSMPRTESAAKQALEHEGLWTALQNRIVYGENVRQTLQFARHGQCGCGDRGVVSRQR